MLKKIILVSILIVLPAFAEENKTTPCEYPPTECLSGNCKDGDGISVYPDKYKYEGSFKDGKFSGQGKFIDYKNEYIYEGQFINNLFNGQGKMVFSNGSFYEGRWENNKENGYGVYTYINENTYSGEFKDNQYNGKGMLKRKDGTVLKQGFWKDDKYIGEKP